MRRAGTLRSMSRFHRTISVVGAATLGLAFLAGCSQPGTITISSKPPSAPVAATASGSGSMSGSAPAGATLAALRSAGEATSSLSSGRYESTIADGDGNVFMTLTGEFSGDRTRQSTRLSTGELLGDDAPADGVTTEMITDGSTLYVGGSLLAEFTGLFSDSAEGDEPGAGQVEWYRFDVPEGDTPFDGGDLFGSAVGQDLGRETASLLSGAYGEVITIGPEEVRGLATTHSSVDVDLGKVLGDLGGLTDELGEGTVPVDVWLGDDGLVHRMRFEINPTALGLPGGGATSMVSTFELWDVDADITIDVPENATAFDPTTIFGGR